MALGFLAGPAFANVAPILGSVGAGFFKWKAGQASAQAGAMSAQYGRQNFLDKLKADQDANWLQIAQAVQGHGMAKNMLKYQQGLAFDEMKKAPEFASLLGQAGTEIERRKRNYFFEPDSKRQRLANIGENNFGTLWGGTTADMFGTTARQEAKEAMAREYRRSA